MFVKYYHDLHPLIGNGNAYVKEMVIEDCNMDIFEMTIKTNGPIKVVINRELLISKKYQVDKKEIKCPLQWWKKHEFVFLTLNFPTCQKISIAWSKKF
jgi:hypothetical protein